MPSMGKGSGPRSGSFEPGLVVEDDREGSLVVDGGSPRPSGQAPRDRFTVADGRSLRSDPPRRESSSSSQLFAEVSMLMEDLQKRADALEPLFGGADCGAEGSDGGALPQDDDDDAAAITVTMTPDQKRALSGLASNVRGLVRCLDHRRGQILLTVDDDRDGFAGQDQERDSPDDTLPRLRSCAQTPSQKKLLDRVLGTRAARNRGSGGVGGSGSRATVFATNRGMKTLRRRSTEEDSAIPKELIRSLRTNENSAETAAAAFLAHEYGGVELPSNFLTLRADPRKSFRDFARAMSKANLFVGQVKAEGNIGICELDYLPREFTRLDARNRKTLTRMLSWGGLGWWGLDAFDIERLSAIRGFRKTMSAPIDLADDPDSRQHSERWEDSEAVESAMQRGCPLVLLGWAILASPYSQLAMARNVNDKELIASAMKALKQRANTAKCTMARRILSGGDAGGSDSENEEEGGGSGDNMVRPITPTGADRDGEGVEEDSNTSSGNNEKGRFLTGGPGDAYGGYFLPDEFEVSPRSVCRFMRKVEKDYHPHSVNPYHNNVHAADVLQTTHSLIQMGGPDMNLVFTPLEIYSMLLAAACHDIRHPGTSNNYQVNKRTELALTYNDNSVLENMHASRTACLLEGISDGNKTSNGGTKETKGILGAMKKEQRREFRTSVMRSILLTDMSFHFKNMAEMTEKVKALEDEIAREAAVKSFSSPPPPQSSHVAPLSRSLLERLSGDKHKKLREMFLPFVLHMADISNAAKPLGVCITWSDAVYDEFFLQGDREKAEGMPVSPLCDRASTSRPEAQLGFMTYVVRPAYVLLARCIPKVDELVLGEMEKNFQYWEGEKERVVMGALTPQLVEEEHGEGE